MRHFEDRIGNTLLTWLSGSYVSRQLKFVLQTFILKHFYKLKSLDFLHKITITTKTNRRSRNIGFVSRKQLNLKKILITAFNELFNETLKLNWKSDKNKQNSILFAALLKYKNI